MTTFSALRHQGQTKMKLYGSVSFVHTYRQCHLFVSIIFDRFNIMCKQYYETTLNPFLNDAQNGDTDSTWCKLGCSREIELRLGAQNTWILGVNVFFFTLVLTGTCGPLAVMDSRQSLNSFKLQLRIQWVEWILWL